MGGSRYTPIGASRESAKLLDTLILLLLFVIIPYKVIKWTFIHHGEWGNDLMDMVMCLHDLLWNYVLEQTTRNIIA